MTQPSQPSILIITRNYPPLTGGMERLLHNMSIGLSKHARLTIVGPSGCSTFAPKGAQVFECRERLAPYMLLSFVHSVRACLANNFDIIIGGSGLTAPTLACLGSLFRSKTVVMLHGLDLVVDNWWYQKVFIPTIRRADLVIANSNSTREIAISKGVSAQNISIVNPGTSIPDLNNIGPRDCFCNEYDIPFDKVLLFAGRMTRRKGLSSFIKNSLPRILEAEPRCGLVVVGENPDQGLTKLGEAEEVRRLIEAMGLEDKVRFLGQLPDDELEKAFAHSDLHIFPVIEVPGDIEGFGMVAVEAAACGTPTVAFAVGGVVDAISELNGELVEPARYELFSEAVIRLIRRNKHSASMCIKHASDYCWDIYNNRVRQIVDGLL